MTVVMRPADARLNASIMISSSITLLFTGELRGWTMKTSLARTFSRMRTKMFSLLNSKTSHWPSGISREAQMSWASCGWALPVKTARSWYCIMSPRRCLCFGCIAPLALLRRASPAVLRGPAGGCTLRAMSAAGLPTASPDEPVRSCYHSAQAPLREDLSLEEISRALADPHGLLWLDIHADGRDEGEPILRDIFRFHPLTIDDCYNTLIDPPKVDDYGEYLFIIVHNLMYNTP